MTRDSKLWNILMAVGAVLALLSAMPDTTLAVQYGIPLVAIPPIRLAAFLLTAAGKFGNSPLPHSEDVAAIKPRP
jgi:hypothetical protein